MPILTIELPDAEYHAALALPASEQRRVLSLAANRYAIATNERQDEYEPTEADLIAVGEGIAALDAGQTVNSDDFFASLEKKHDWKL